MSNNEQPQKQGGDKNKEEKKFEARMRKLIAVLGGESLFKPTKVAGGDELQKAVAELAKEEKEKLVLSFKSQASALIQRKREFDKFVKGEKEKMDNAILAKKKEFGAEMDKLFTMIGSIENVERSYYATLSGLSNVVAVKEETEDPDDDEPTGEEEATPASEA